MRGLPSLEDLRMDVRHALRALWRSPAFTLVAVVTLMLAIGANVVVFGVLNAVLLRPLDVRDPQNLYQLRLKPWASGKLLTTSYPAFEDYRQRSTTFSTDLRADWIRPYTRSRFADGTITQTTNASIRKTLYDDQPGSYSLAFSCSYGGIAQLSIPNCA